MHCAGGSEGGDGRGAGRRHPVLQELGLSHYLLLLPGAHLTAEVK